MKILFILLISSMTCFGQNYVPIYVPQSSGGVPSCNNQLAAITSSGTRSDSFWVGFKFTVGATNITVCTLERAAMGSTSTMTHAVTIFSSAGIVASANVNMTGITVGNYGSMPIGLTTLTAGQTYVLAVNETIGDNWWDETTCIAIGGCLVVDIVFAASTPISSASFTGLGIQNQTFSGPNILFQ